MASHDPRGLVDTTKGEINEESARLCRELSAGTLAPTLTELSLKKAGLTTLPPRSAVAALRKLDVGFNALSTLPSKSPTSPACASSSRSETRSRRSRP